MEIVCFLALFCCFCMAFSELPGTSCLTNSDCNLKEECVHQSNTNPGEYVPCSSQEICSCRKVCSSNINYIISHDDGCNLEGSADIEKNLGNVLLNVFSTVSFLGDSSKYMSCKDVYFADPSSSSGEYRIFNKAGKAFDVYCDFHQGYLYTYISKTSQINIDLDVLFNNNSHAIVRILGSAGNQREVFMEQLSQYTSQYPLSLQYNKAIGYQQPSSHQILSPYLFLGFLPHREARKRTIQGYRSNRHDHTFVNCDGNPNSYMAFFFNPDDRDVTEYYGNRCCNTTLLHAWVNDAYALTSQAYIPSNYFFPIEIHMGGCGCYGISGDRLLVEVSGAALGLRTDFVDPRASASHQHDCQCSSQTGNNMFCECTHGGNNLCDKRR